MTQIEGDNIMKGSVISSWKDFITEKKGKKFWDEILEEAGLQHKVILASSDFEDEKAAKILGIAAKKMNIPVAKLANELGEYWVLVSTQKLYSSYYRKYKQLKDFILAMDNIHVEITNSVKNAKPPRFKYKWINESTLEMEYISHRKMMDYLLGALKGSSKYYDTPIRLRQIGTNKVVITF